MLANLSRPQRSHRRAAGHPGQIADDAFDQLVAPRHDVALHVAARGLVLTKIDVGTRERVLVQQGGVERELRVLRTAFHALGGA